MTDVCKYFYIYIVDEQLQLIACAPGFVTVAVLGCPILGGMGWKVLWGGGGSRGKREG